MPSVWMIPVFAYCLWVGKIFAKRCKGHWTTFLFFPTVFMITAFFSLLVTGGLLCWSFYLICLWSGCAAGLLITNPVPIKVDVVRQTVAAPGSWLVLICLVTLCISKCTFDWLYVSMPAHTAQFKVISFSIKGVMTGLLYGQALSFWYRLLIANTCSSAELVRNRLAFFCGLERASHIENTGCPICCMKNCLVCRSC